MPQDPKISLHPHDTAHFLKLSAALRILIRRDLSDDDIDRADALIREYNVELIHLYGSGAIKNHHHFPTHTNNHANGGLETIIFRGFQSTCEIGRLLIYKSQGYYTNSFSSVWTHYLRPVAHKTPSSSFYRIARDADKTLPTYEREDYHGTYYWTKDEWQKEYQNGRGVQTLLSSS
ncbi:hypothetical protein DFJ58DRAFT_843343 [Suillus subalutaceus]|uniref:uncharacterized protein n=1 Tax=Suillus subalutaceus TaxID=48586 RepID=UPI001B8664B9|nr:uncharacterized protein DFJ58DRAFT_843343 [Suillus subalutaceus]KAG1847027.1 hypothetical protein DFJ58DRAFT_843343 [Suillus subalutaceus]